MKLKAFTAACLLPATIIAANTVIADDDTGFFVSVTANRLSADFEDVNDVKFGESDTTPGIRGGYMFNDMFGVELGYLDLGDYQATGNRPENRIDLNADAYSAAGVVNWSVAETVDLYGKLGVYHIDADSNSVVAGAQFDSTNDETEVFGAIGAEYDFGHLNLFAEISKADTDVNELTIDIATVGVKYEF